MSKKDKKATAKASQDVPKADAEAMTDSVPGSVDAPIDAEELDASAQNEGDGAGDANTVEVAEKSADTSMETAEMPVVGVVEDEAEDSAKDTAPPIAAMGDAEITVNEPGQEAVEIDDSPKRKSRRRRIGLLSVLVVAALVLVLVIGVIGAIGRPIIAPEWVRIRIENRVNQEINGVDLTFGEVQFIIEEEWHPRVVMRDIDLKDPAGQLILSLSDVESTLSMRSLLRGKLRPNRIWLTGAQVHLQRDKNGQVGLSFGNALRPAKQAANMAQLLAGVDQVLEQPGLSALHSIEADGLTVRYDDLRAGRSWTVDGGRISMARAGDDLTLRGDFALLGGRDFASTIEMNYQRKIGSVAATFGVSFEDMPAGEIATQSAALLWLNTLRAPISGALRASVGADGALGPLSATLQIGEGVLQPRDETTPIPFQSARSYFTYSPATQTMQFDEMSVVSKWVSARAEGKVIVGELINGWPKEFLGQMRLTELRANPNALYPSPIQIENATMDVRLEVNPFRLTLGELTLSDQGKKLILTGDVRAKSEGWDLALQGQMGGLAPKRLLELWPASLKPPTRAWIAKNILSGTMRNLQLGLRARPGTKPDVYLGFDFADVETTFMKNMPPLKGASGHASLLRNQFSVVADTGQVLSDQGGVIDVTGTSFIIEDVRIKRAPAKIRLRSESTITAALALLNRKPFEFLTKAGQPVTLADGRAVAQGEIDIILKKKLTPDEVKFNIAGTLFDVRSTKIVPGRVMAARELAITADNQQLRIEGSGRIGTVPIAGHFVAPLGVGGSSPKISKVRGWVELSDRFVREFNIGLPSGSVSGAGRGNVEIDLQKGQRPVFSMQSNLSGLGLRIAPIGWSMGRKTRGKLTVSGTLGTPVAIDKINMSAPGLKASGRLNLTAKGGFKSAVFDRVRAGNWLDAPVTLVGRGVGRSPGVKVLGGWVDMRKTSIGEGNSGGSTQGGGPIEVALDSLRITEGIALTGFRGKFSTAKGMDGSFSGRVNRAAAVTGRIVPKKGRSAFRILSKDAGGVFKSAGVFTGARGGDFSLTLLPGGGEGSYDGTLRVTDVRLKDAPAMAELLSAVSVIGLLEQLDGEGIPFQAVDAKFRLTPTQAIFTESSAIGNSMGISMDGIYDLISGKMDMQGVVSPLFLVNGIGSFLTRKGEGLIGFNYNLRGTADKPKVKVNPLSLFTPGMFREIFRRPAPKVSK